MRFRKISALILVWLIILFYSVTASGTERLGSIEIKVIRKGNPVEGGTIELYCVAYKAGEEYKIEDAFRDADIEKLPWEKPETAKILSEYAKRNATAGKVQAVSDEGITLFSDLPEGIYLVTQKEAPKGYHPISPFLVAIPSYIEESDDYHVVAYPKIIENIQGSSPKTGQSLLSYYMFVLSGTGIVMVLSLIKMENVRSKRKK